VAVALAPGQAAGATPKPKQKPGPSVIARKDFALSNERTMTRWAHPLARASVRARPSNAAKRVGRLHLLTEDGRPEVYLLLAARQVGETLWFHIRLPGRPNGGTGWVPDVALGPAEPTTWALLIDRTRLRATLYHAGKNVWSAPIGIGKAASPTPAGHFWIRELLVVPGTSIYGPYAFGTSAYSILTDWPGGGVVGIHGTNEPWLIPGRPSHGCIRMNNDDIRYLAAHLPIGAPVRIV